MTCKVCERDYHVCFSCGKPIIWMFDYCSEQCLSADHKKPCPICCGWVGDECGSDCVGYVDAVSKEVEHGP